MMTFEQALATVREKLSGSRLLPRAERLLLAETPGRVLAEDIRADRDYPPFNRATRDGYAVRSADLASVPVTLECLGEVRAGENFPAKVAAGQCVEIMTGAPLPEGADAVVMLEHTHAHDGKIEALRAVKPRENVVAKGSEAAAGTVVLRQGRRVGTGEIGLLAAVGQTRARVFRRPRVAILTTGDEVVAVERRPDWFQIRNSNSISLAAQVTAAGGMPHALGVAPDKLGPLRRLIRKGLACDLFVLSGGVSMGKYDFVAKVLSEFGAEFYVQGVAIRPGKPFAFGSVGKKFFFALPGNPVSTFVTFELFVRPAVLMAAGAPFECPVFLRARLAKPFRQNTGLTAFMPARVEREGRDAVVSPVGWQGSGDLVGVAAANCFLVVHPDQSTLEAGGWVDVLPKSY